MNNNTKKVSIGDSVYVEYCEKRFNSKKNFGFYYKFHNFEFIFNFKGKVLLKFAPKRFYSKKQVLFEKNLIKFYKLY